MKKLLLTALVCLISASSFAREGVDNNSSIT